MIISRTTAAWLLGVRPDTIHQWIARGHITAHPTGVDLTECLTWLDQRHTAKIRTPPTHPPQGPLHP